jgi:hypothetical protein
MTLKPRKLVVLIGVFVFGAISCDRFLCVQDTVAVVTSPDGVQVATVVNISCGAAAQDGMTIYLGGRPHWYSSGRGTEIAMLANRHNVPKLSWVDNQTLKIGLSELDSSDLRRKRMQVGSVSVVFPVFPLLRLAPGGGYQ